MSFCDISKRQNSSNEIELVGLQKLFKVPEQVSKYQKK